MIALWNLTECGDITCRLSNGKSQRTILHTAACKGECKVTDDIKLLVGDCSDCGAAIVMFGTSSCGPCHECGLLYGVAINIRPAGVLRMAWVRNGFKNF